MNTLITWFARNRVAANLLMILLLIGGIMSAFSIGRTAFPDFPPETITISVLYPGASPEEVEESIIIKIEEAVQGIDGVDRITSNANENLGVVTIEIEDGASLQDIKDEVKAEVDGITTFPEDAEQPVIQEAELQERAVFLVVAGDIDERSLKKLTDDMREEIISLPEISKAEVVDARAYEISIDVREEDLRRYRISFSDLAVAVQRFSLNLPAGAVETRDGEILIRSSSQAYNSREFARIPLLTQPDGTEILVGDVADVRETFEDVTLQTWVDGRKSLMIQVYRVGDQDTLEVSDAIDTYVQQKQTELPNGVELVEYRDISDNLNERLDLLFNNGMIGLALVFLVLAFFLKARLAFWVAVGLSAAVMGTVWVMPWFGMTINFLTSFGFILALGILVDDAIVVSENIDAHRRMGKKPMEAAITGTREVLIPVVLAVVTTAIAFSPMLQLPGRTGIFAGAIAAVVILAVGMSLVEALLILPAHLSHGGEEKKTKGIAYQWGRVQGKFDDLVQWFIDKTYKPVLHRAIEWRYLVMAAGLGFLILTSGLFRGGWVKFSFFPEIEGDEVTAALVLKEGVSEEETRAAIGILEDAALEIRLEIEGNETGSVIKHVRTSIGSQTMAGQGGPGGLSGPSQSRTNVGEVHLNLVSAEDRTIKASEIRDRWRAKVKDRIPNAVSLTIVSSQISVGAPINVELSGNDINELEAAAEELKDKLSEYAGTFDITDDYREGKLEIIPTVTASGRTLGLTQQSLMAQVRSAFYGNEAQRAQIGKDEVKVFVRYPEELRSSISDLENMRVRLPSGEEAAFGEVARYEIGRGVSTISRIDRKRTIVVSSNLNRSVGNADEIASDLSQSFLPQLSEKYTGVNWQYGGEQARQQESVASLRTGLILSLFLMFTLLAVAFKSYFQPVIIMWAVPFGVAGALWAHFAFGMDLTFLSIVGLLGLSGVVVNDSLVMIDFVNRFRRDEGMSLFEAVKAAGPRRFRPILLTSMTTFAGLTPIMLERSVQAAFLIPMAVSLAFGIAFATVIILVMVPCTYLVLEDALQLIRKLLNKDIDPERGERGEPQVVIDEIPDLDQPITLERQ